MARNLIRSVSQIGAKAPLWKFVPMAALLG